MYYERLISNKLTELFAHFPCVVVTGARQTGKSTLLQHLFGTKGETVVFDPVQDIQNARRDPDLFLQNHRRPLILDEIQFAPELVPALKRWIDRDRTPGQYLLTGSQQWSVLKTLSESLAGRAVFLDLEGFCLAEIAQKPQDDWLEAWLSDPGKVLQELPGRFSLPLSPWEQTWRGQLPEAQFLPLGLLPDYHAGYFRTYVERDARLLVQVEDWQLFGRFVRLASALTAREVNRSQLGRELGLRSQTAQRWLSVLQAGFQWFEVAPLHGNTLKRISGRPKGYFADTGLACFLQSVTTPQTLGGHPLWGPLFETFVVGDIRKRLARISPAPTLFHWRSHGGAEVDLVLEKDGAWYPIEIKSGTHPALGDAGGIQALRKTYPGKKIQAGLVIAPVEKPYRLKDDLLVLPWDAAKP